LPIIYPMTVYRLSKDIVFPPVENAEPDGLLAVGGDLSPERLLLAYENGIFPWYDDKNPILWWSPDPRMVIEPAKFHCSRSLRKTIRSGRFGVSFDCAFPDVIAACAKIKRRGERGTWITGDMRKAYTRLHELGYAHSVECWHGGELVGGLYGLSLGASFFGESMFSKETDASKTAIAALCAHLIAWDMPLLDCQVANPHLESLGAHAITREEFIGRLRKGMLKPTRMGKWEIDAAVWAF